MPWPPELFSAPIVARLQRETRDRRLGAIPYFDGLMSGEVDALVSAFSGVPELHHPVRGRVKGERAFRAFVATTVAELQAQHASFESVNVIVTEARTIEEVVLTYDGENGRVEVPIAIAADRDTRGRLTELRMYFSTWPINGSHAIRQPLLQRDPDLHEADVVGEYQRALAAGDVEAAVAAFETTGSVREPAGGSYLHRGTDELRALFTLFFSNGGGIPLEHCTATDDGTACGLEYNVVRWGRTPMPPEAGIAVYTRGSSGRLATARIYDDSNPPLGHA